MSEFYADTKQYQINSPYDGYAEQILRLVGFGLCSPKILKSKKARGLQKY